LKSEDWEFLLAEDLLVVLKRKFEGEDNELAKVVGLKQVKQGFWTMDKYV